MTIRLRNNDQQPYGTNLCGYYAIAFAVLISRSVDPTLKYFTPSDLVRYVKEGLELGHFGNTINYRTADGDANVRVLRIRKLHCRCQGSYLSGSMVTCSQCGSHYHGQCVSTNFGIRSPLESWKGPCCYTELSDRVEAMEI